MRPILVSIAVAVLLATAGPAWADDDKDESGRGRGKGRGGPPPWAGRGDKDQKEYYKRLEKQQKEDRKRFEEQQREGRKRYEERYRDDDKRARETEREYREVYPAGISRGDGYRQSGYRGYTPTAPYPARLAPQPGGYDGYPAQPTYPSANGRGAALADQPFGDVVDYLGYGQDGYGGNPPPGLGVPYGPGRVAPYREEVPLQPDGYDGYRNPPQGPYRADQYPSGPSESVPLTAPLEVDDYLPPEDPEAFEGRFAPQTGGQITALADQLAGQAETYLREFLPKLGVVPESQRFLADGTVLRDAAIRFREAALRGAPPADLAAEFRNVEAGWQRLEARMVRVSKGRIGPNIARNLQMGETIGQIRQLMPY